MEQEQEQLQLFKEYGESVVESIDSASDKQSLPDWVPPELPQSLENLRQAAQKTIELASSPVKIGVMGEFSGGKTLLLGSLIGYADALPVSETPTTGNVTAVHLLQQEDLQTTQVGEFTVQYLSHSEVKECLAFMLKEASARAKAAQLPQAQLDAIKNLTPTNTVDNNGILRWCEAAWKNAQNKELRSLLRELVVFVRAYSVYGADICNRLYKIDPATAKEGLRLPDPPMNILEQGFDELPPSPQPWQNLAAPSAWELQKSFSLIRRIDVTVKVSKQIWNLSALAGTKEFVLLDFPGLGAAESGVRDRFLSLRELAEVQTILLVLNGKQPGGETADRIRTMMEQDKGTDLRDRILVGVGRFNQLPLAGTDIKVIDKLIGDNFLGEQPSPLLEEEVLEDLKILKATIAGARNLTTKPERIVLLSQMWALDSLRDRFSTLQVCSPEFETNLNYPGKSDETQLREKLRLLSDRLRDSGSDRILRQQLRDFADDGGISRLRSLILDHVKQYGLKQLGEDTHRAAENLLREQNNLKTILERVPDYIETPESSTFAILRETIENLQNTYRKFREDLDKKPLQDRSGVAVSDVIAAEVTNKIFFDWSEWNLLFNNTKEGTIEISTSERKTGGAAFFDDDDDEDDDLIPTKTDDFYPSFARTIEELEEFARDRIREAVTDLLSKLSRDIEPQRNNLRDILRPELKQEIQEKFKKSDGRLFNTLLRADDPSQWRETVVKESEVNGNGAAKIEPKIIFPLAREDDRHQIGQRFDWSPEKKYPTPPKPFNHLILVVRLRDEINASAKLHLVQYVSEVTEKVNASFRGFLDVLIPRLQEISRKEALLKYIAAEESQTQKPAWLRELSQIASISYPEKPHS